MSPILTKMQQIKKFFWTQNFATRIRTTVLFFILLPIVLLRLSGALQPFEFAAYDLLFYLGREEPPDPRIVLVTWDEEDIQVTQESTLSDRTLSFVLEQIIKDRPSLIGLDLFRNVPETSDLLSDRQNDESYAKLQQIFKSTENLYGIEKVLEPIIKPPLVLKQETRVGSSDVLADSDQRIRRGYIDPRPFVNGGPEYKSIPYLGAILAERYLSKLGWQYKPIDYPGFIAFFKDDKSVNLIQLKEFDGAYNRNYAGVDFLINFRRGKKPFQIVPISDFLSEKVPQDIFKDKIVLIGNTASSTADRHYLASSRWVNSSEESWSYGVFLQAHVTSSIISAALDNRPLITVFPYGIGYWLTIITATIIARAFYVYQNFKFIRLAYIIVFLTFALIIPLIIISLLAFEYGFWIPIAPSILAIFLTIFLLTNLLSIEKERKNSTFIKQITRDVFHNMRNAMNKQINSIALLKGKIDQSYELAEKMHQELQEVYDDEDIIAFSETNLGSCLSNATQYLQRQEDLIFKINDQIGAYDTFMGNIVTIKEKFNLNNFLQKILENFVDSCDILVTRQYDIQIKQVFLNKTNITLIITNLIENAIKAVEKQQNHSLPNYKPEIQISTQKKGKFVVIIIEDNGIGIEPSYRSAIFNEFQSHWSPPSTGLGLAIVKRRVEAEGGKIEVKSSPNVGSKFIVTLPISNL